MNTYGWSGTILYVDLTTEKIEKKPLDMQMAKDYLGGSGFGTRLLWDLLPPGTHPFDPANPFIISTSPIAGTVAPSSGRVSIDYLSPLTGLICTGNAGGFFASELKWAGYDAVVITGKANRPVWLYINNDHVEIRDAKNLWGKESWDTIRGIHADVHDHSLATIVIGPAGENLVTYAIPLVERTRQQGKGGGGAVMGSKNLKAIGVRGSKGTRLADPKTFEELSFTLRKRIQSGPSYPAWNDYGTPFLYEILEQHHGVLPTYNYQHGEYPEGRKSLSHVTLKQNFEVRPNASCYGCPIQCARILEIKSGKYKGLKTEGIDYYTHYLFGPNVGVANWEFVIKATDVMYQLGFQVTVVAVMGWVAELYQRGLITKEKLDGIDLTWGNEEAFLELMRKIAYREGIGNILANSFLESGTALGKETLKYQPVITKWDTSEDPRARMDVALSHLISTRGGDHHRALAYWTWFTPPEYTQALIPGIPKEAIDMYSPVGKPEVVELSERAHAICDMLSSCYWPSWMIMPYEGVVPEEYAKLLTAATGVEYDVDKLYKCTERMLVLQRAFNVREGFDRSVYEMSDLWYETAFPEGPQKGVTADRAVVKKMVDDFLVLRGFDPKTGFPTRKVMEKLGLSKEADQLEKMGRIAKPETVPAGDAAPSKKK